MRITGLQPLDGVYEHRQRFFVAWCSIKVFDRRSPNSMVDDIKGVIQKPFPCFKPTKLPTGRFGDTSRLDQPIVETLILCSEARHVLILKGLSSVVSSFLLRDDPETLGCAALLLKAERGDTTGPKELRYDGERYLKVLGVMVLTRQDDHILLTSADGLAVLF